MRPSACVLFVIVLIGATPLVHADQPFPAEMQADVGLIIPDVDFRLRWRPPILVIRDDDDNDDGSALSFEVRRGFSDDKPLMNPGLYPPIPLRRHANVFGLPRILSRCGNDIGIGLAENPNSWRR